MHPFKIQYELKKRGITQKTIADSIPVSEMYVSRVINHKKDAFRKGDKAEKVRNAVAAALGMTPEEVFPGIYRALKKSRSKAA